MRHPLPLRSLAALGGLLAALAGCGRAAPPDIPVSYEQAVPWTAAGQAAINPPRDENGRPQAVPTLPRRVPAFPGSAADALLN